MPPTGLPPMPAFVEPALYEQPGFVPTVPQRSRAEIRARNRKALGYASLAVVVAIAALVLLMMWMVRRAERGEEPPGLLPRPAAIELVVST